MQRELVGLGAGINRVTGAGFHRNGVAGVAQGLLKIWDWPEFTFGQSARNLV